MRQIDMVRSQSFYGYVPLLINTNSAFHLKDQATHTLQCRVNFFGVMALFFPQEIVVLCSLGVLSASTSVSILFNICAAFSGIDSLICFDASVIKV